MAPTTQYARSGDASIAYQVIGEGPLDLLFVLPWMTHLEHAWEVPGARRFFERLAAFTRLILFDQRGSGSLIVVRRTRSSRMRGTPRGARRSRQRARSSADTGIGRPGRGALAAEHPDRVSALIMYQAIARSSWAPGYEWAMTREQRDELASVIWLDGAEPAVRCCRDTHLLWPTIRGLSHGSRALNVWPPAQVRRRQGGELPAISTSARSLPRIRVPTLIMHRPRELVWDVRHSRYLADHIPGARYVELDGVDSLFFVGDSDAIIDETAEFLTGERTAGELTRALLTVVFTDIVAATSRASELGDRRWRDLLAEHDASVRKQLSRFGGREVKTIGDGFLAVFDGPPSRALHCAQAVTTVVRDLGVEIRVGIHTGECELIGVDVGGMAVHIASRVGALAGPGEVLVSDMVRGTVVGGSFTFEDRGTHQLKGVPGRWPLFALRA